VAKRSSTLYFGGVLGKMKILKSVVVMVCPYYTDEVMKNVWIKHDFFVKNEKKRRNLNFL